MWAAGEFRVGGTRFAKGVAALDLTPGENIILPAAGMARGRNRAKEDRAGETITTEN
jgi:hypothetical protein